MLKSNYIHREQLERSKFHASLQEQRKRVSREFCIQNICKIHSRDIHNFMPSRPSNWRLNATEKFVWKFTFNYWSTYSIGTKAHMQRHSTNFCSWYLLQPNTIQNNEWHFIFISRKTNKYIKEIWEHWRSSYLSYVSTASQSNVNFFFLPIQSNVIHHTVTKYHQPLYQMFLFGPQTWYRTFFLWHIASMGCHFLTCLACGLSYT